MTSPKAVATVATVVHESEIPPEYRGWWRLIETSTWGSDDIDIQGRALLSLTGRDDRLRMFVLLARVQATATKAGDDSTFLAERAEQPDEPIEDPPSYRDKWRRRW